MFDPLDIRRIEMLRDADGETLEDIVFEPWTESNVDHVWVPGAEITSQVLRVLVKHIRRPGTEEDEYGPDGFYPDYVEVVLFSWGEISHPTMMILESTCRGNLELVQISNMKFKEVIPFKYENSFRYIFIASGSFHVVENKLEDCALLQRCGSIFGNIDQEIV